MRARLFAFALVAATVASLTSAGVASAAQSIPLNVTFTTTTVQSTQPCSTLAFVADAAFTGPQHLAASTFHADVCLTGMTGPDGLLLLTGGFTITTRNGATIVGTGTGETDGPNFTHWNYTITGGTKQFSHATGSLDLSEVITSFGFPGPIISNDTLTGTVQR